jgi:type I restriction enzyme M protein
MKGNDSTANELLLPELQKNYPCAIDKSDRFSIGDSSIKTSFQVLSDINLVNAPSYILGEAFQALIGPRLRGDKGQFFTPRSLVKAMVRILDPKPYSKVVDPACGTGSFLSETYSYLIDTQAESALPNNQYSLIGIDKDKDLSRLATATLEIVAPNNYSVFTTDSLDINSLIATGISYKIFNADLVLTNPPFGAKIGVTRESILQQYDLGHHWSFSSEDNCWIKSDKVRKNQDPQILFIELCVKILKPGGVLGIVLPEGVFGNKQTGYIWDYLRHEGSIKALVDCPRTTFQPGTDTKTNVLFFQKFKEKSENVVGSAIQVPIAVALHCGHDRRGRVFKENGEKYPDDFITIAEEFKKNDNSNYWSTCEIQNPYYWVPRFYDVALNKSIQKKAFKLGADLISFNELVESGYISIRKGHEVGSQAYGTGNVPFIRTSDIANWEVSVDPTNAVSEEIFHQYAKHQKLNTGDILLVVDGRYRIGRTAILHPNNIRSVVQSHIRIITVTVKAPFSSYELLYMLNMPLILQQMRNLTFIQSTLGSIGKRLGQLQIFIPSKTEDWITEINNFERLLTARASILSDLQKFRTPEPEL